VVPLVPGILETQIAKRRLAMQLELARSMMEAFSPCRKTRIADRLGDSGTVKPDSTLTPPAEIGWVPV